METQKTPTSSSTSGAHQIYLEGAIHQFQIGTYDNFTYLLLSKSSQEAWVVDPQTDLKPWEEILTQEKSTLKGCFITHTHWDHVIGIPALLKKYAVPIYLHEIDAKTWPDKPVTPHSNEQTLCFLNDGDQLPLGDLQLEVLHTPGHSAGELTYCVSRSKAPQAAPALLTGDVVFVGEVGRTDLATGNVSALFATLKRLKALSAQKNFGPASIILPGHDYGISPASTLEFEMKNSLAFQCQTVEELDALP